MIENVSYRNITTRNVCTPFYIAITPRKGAGKIRNVRFENVTATDISSDPKYSQRPPKAYWVSTINGLKQSPIDKIILRNLMLAYKGGVQETMDRILNKQMDETLKLLGENRHHVNAVVAALVEKERLTSEDLQKILPLIPRNPTLTSRLVRV